MAKFNLQIETDDPAELADIVAAIAGASGEREDDEPAKEGEAPKTRVRRTKAQIAADEAAAKNAAGNAIEKIEEAPGFQVDEPAAEKTLTLGDIQALIRQAIGKPSVGAPGVNKIIQEIAPGSKTTADIPQDKWPAIAAAFEAALG